MRLNNVLCACSCVVGKRVHFLLHPGVSLLAWGPDFSFTVAVISITTLISVKHPGEFMTT